jgi:hypothetical protein
MRIARLVVMFGFAAALLPSQLRSAHAADGKPLEKVSFYFAAHQDDWQLFMNPSAFQDVTRKRTKAVFIHMTAGDAGLGAGSGGRKHPFYLARDNGAEAAIRFMADGDNPPGDKSAAPMIFNGHPIYRVSYRNTVSYFLRVPDGNAQGSGYPHTGYQSLLRLASDEITTLAAVDGSTAYKSWPDLVGTVRAIIDHERANAAVVQINVAERDQRLNPADHSDHQMTAKAALDAVAGLGCVRRAYYVNYASSKLPENLTSQLRDMESSVFAVTSATIRALDHSSNWQYYDRAFVGRNYYRVEEGAGRCTGAVEDVSAAKR